MYDVRLKRFSRGKWIRDVGLYKTMEDAAKGIAWEMHKIDILPEDRTDKVDVKDRETGGTKRFEVSFECRVREIVKYQTESLVQPYQSQGPD